MIFLVPDLERYDAVRGGVIPYAPQRPGPHVTTTQEVVGLVRDLDGWLAAVPLAQRETFRVITPTSTTATPAARLVDAVFPATRGGT